MDAYNIATYTHTHKLNLSNGTPNHLPSKGIKQLPTRI